MCDTFDKELSKSNTQMAYARVGAEVVGYVVFGASSHCAPLFPARPCLPRCLDMDGH